MAALEEVSLAQQLGIEREALSNLSQVDIGQSTTSCSSGSFPEIACSSASLMDPSEACAADDEAFRARWTLFRCCAADCESGEMVHLNEFNNPQAVLQMYPLYGERSRGSVSSQLGPLSARRHDPDRLTAGHEGIAFTPHSRGSPLSARYYQPDALTARPGASAFAAYDDTDSRMHSGRCIAH